MPMIKAKRKKAQKITHAELKAGKTFSDSHADGTSVVFIFVHLGMLHVQTKNAKGDVTDDIAVEFKGGDMSMYKRWYRALTGQPYVDVRDNQHEGIWYVPDL
jgi:hypothetical protein